ncbi:glycine oxidase ThiO [Persephonella sp.]
MKGIIIGGGIIGLSIARSLLKEGYSLTIIDKDRIGRGASWAAGGMLAPQSEGLDKGAFLDLCIKSRDMYRVFIEEIEEETGVKTGYWESGIICPAFSDDEADMLKKKLDVYISEGLTGKWLNRKELEEIYSPLGSNVLGGVLYDKDGQVDSRAVLKALVASVKDLKAEVVENCKVISIEQKNGSFTGVKTEKGDIYGDFCVVCAGAWSGQLLSIPVYPIKGEMLAINQDVKRLNKIFYSRKAYIIPRKDKTRIVIGATEENVGFKDGNTVKGVKKLLDGLIETFPNMKNREIVEIWYGYRPATPDLLPVLGKTYVENLYIATGHYRNGILLAPITTKLLTDLIINGKENQYTEIFSYKRVVG